MAHRTEHAAKLDVIKQQTEPAYRVIIVWKKDWDRWNTALKSAIDTTRYLLLTPPVMRTKNQVCIAEAKTHEKPDPGPTQEGQEIVQGR